MKKLISSLVVICCAFHLQAQEYDRPMENVQEFKQQVQESSGSIESIRSDFEQEKHLAVLNEPSESSGEFFFKRGGFVRWEYRQPEQQSIILNGDNVNIIKEGELERTNSRTARAYRQMNDLIANVIHGDAFADTNFEYEFYEADDHRGTVVMRPKQSAIAAHLESIELYFNDEHRVEELHLNEPGGDYTRYMFYDQEYNIDLPEKIFQPEPVE